MYFILAKDCSKAFYLFENQEYTLGRKACDIIIGNDTSISRQHASISIKQGKVKITDLGSRYNTFVNNNKLQPNDSTAVNIGDEIKLGILSTIFTLKEQKLITSSSGLTPQEKKVLSKIMKDLNGNVLLTWSKECFYLTVNEILLTLKTLCALIDGQPIVTLDFWINFAKNVKKNLPPPDHNNYKATYAENIINRSIISVNPELRKSLFQNKVFVFKSKLSIAKIEPAVEMAGGTCINFNQNKITKETFSSCNPEYLLIQDEENYSNPNDSFTNILKYLQSVGKRPIPFQEIAMAIVLGSCEKNCNPNFDRTGILLKNEEMVFTSEILARESQTQSESFEEKPTIIVPETELDVKPLESINRILNNTNNIDLTEDDETDKKTPAIMPSIVDNNISVPKTLAVTNKCNAPSTSGKRVGHEVGNDNKRIRLENAEVSTYSSVFGSDPSNLFIKNNIITSTQDTSKDDEDIDIKPLESIDRVLNDTGELELHTAKMNKRPMKNLNEHNSFKRTGEELHKEGKRVRVENSNTNEVGSGTSAHKPIISKSSTIIDLTQDDAKIVTSTQAQSSNIDRSFEANTKKSKPENPFGFIRCGSNSKPKNTANISDFFKPLSKTTQNEESIANISRIDADTALVSGKNKSLEKSSIRENPFAFNKQEKSKINQISFKKSPITSSINKNDTKKINPFGDLRKKTEKNTKRNANESKQREEFVPYTFDIPVIDSEMEKKYSWLSKNSISIKDETDNSLRNTTHLDETMKKFLDSFRNCVVVETLPEPVKRIPQNKSGDETLSGKENFKKFKKVQPLHIQTTIVPRSVYSTC